VLLALLIFIAILTFATGLVFILAAESARDVVKRLAPSYAERLFADGLEAFFSRTPVRFSVLFGKAIPPEAKGWVQPIRIMAALFLCLLALFGLGVVVFGLAAR